MTATLSRILGERTITSCDFEGTHKDSIDFNVTVTDFPDPNTSWLEVPRQLTITLEKKHLKYADAGKDGSNPIWPIILHAISQAIESDPAKWPTVVQSTTTRTQSGPLFECPIDASDTKTIKPCQLGSLMARIMGKSVSAERVPYDIVSKEGGKYGSAIIESAKKAAVIWDENDHVKLPSEVTTDGDIRFMNSDPNEQTERTAKLQAHEQVFLMFAAHG